jgi:3-oxoacyl-[acyl-carrier-protein] synthase II
MARFSQFAVAASVEATEQAGLANSGVDPERLGVILGNGYGGLPNSEEAVRTLITKGGMRLDPFFMLQKTARS